MLFLRMTNKISLESRDTRIFAFRKGWNILDIWNEKGFIVNEITEQGIPVGIPTGIKITNS